MVYLHSAFFVNFSDSKLIWQIFDQRGKKTKQEKSLWFVKTISTHTLKFSSRSSWNFSNFSIFEWKFWIQVNKRGHFPPAFFPSQLYQFARTPQEANTEQGWTQQIYMNIRMNIHGNICFQYSPTSGSTIILYLNTEVEKSREVKNRRVWIPGLS